MTQSIKELEAALTAVVNQPNPDPRQHLDALNALAWAWREGDYRHGKTLVTEAEDLLNSPPFQQDPYRRGEINHLRNQAWYFYLSGRIQSALETAERGLAMAQAGQWLELQPALLETIGFVHLRQGNFPDALDYFMQDYEISKTLGNLRRQANAINNFGIVYAHQEEYDLAEYDLAVEKMTESLELHNAIDNQPGQVRAMVNLGQILSLQGKMEEALSILEEGRQLAEAIDFQETFPYILGNLGVIYDNLGDYQQAVYYTHQAVVHTAEDENPSLHMHYLAILGKLLYELETTAADDETGGLQQLQEAYAAEIGGNPAIYYLGKAMEMAERKGEKYALREYLPILAEAMEQQGDLAAALRRYKEFHEVDRELFNVETQEKLQTLQLEYDIATEKQKADQYRLQTLELAREKEVAEQANQAKSIFLTSMSHDLRTPLNGILGYAQILIRDQRLTAEQHHHVHVIHDSGEHLLNMIDEILDLSKIEAGKVELRLEPVQLREMIERISSMMAGEAASKGLSFTWRIDTPVPDTIIADSVQLQQILLNLLSNAIKFTDEGEVKLEIDLAEGSEPQAATALICFRVSDTGRGIAETDMDKLFAPFEQIDVSPLNAKGTGLGLAISHRLVESMNGHLRVQSQLGEGSQFWFELPVAVAEEAAAVTDRSRRVIRGVGSPAPRILLVDDVPVNRTVLVDILEPMGFTLEEASSGEEAVNKNISFHPHLIFMDLRMPQMDGLEATAAIRSGPINTDPIIIAISASAYAEDRQLSLKAGCDDFIAKPVDMHQLLLQLEDCLGDRWDWLYDEVDSATKPKRPMLSPPKDVTDAILVAASIGDVFTIREQIVELEKMDDSFRPVANELVRLAEQYQIQQIQDLLSSLDRGGAGYE